MTKPKNPFTIRTRLPSREVIEEARRILAEYRALTMKHDPCRPGIRGHCGNPICSRCRPETD